MGLEKGGSFMNEFGLHPPPATPPPFSSVSLCARERERYYTLLDSQKLVNAERIKVLLVHNSF